MSAIAFDTHRIVKRLKEVGFSDLQAEAVTDVLGESRAPVIDISVLATKADLANFATKADLANFATKADITNFATKADLAAFASKTDLAATKAELQIALAETKADILKWVVGAIGLQTIVIVGAVATLARAL